MGKGYAKPTNSYRNHPFNSREGYWITLEAVSPWTEEHGHQRWSVRHCDDNGNVRKHAGKCVADPFSSRTYYLDPLLDRSSSGEQPMFGSDWQYYVQEGVENLGAPEAAAQKRDYSSKSRGVRHDTDEVRAYLAKEPTVTETMRKFGVSRATAYRWHTA
ncbi:MAG: hypothetical protein VX766_17235 [Pseudomonadota bacterium]|nr:hypothetical protein [Pseudomonadota bacterium]